MNFIGALRFQRVTARRVIALLQLPGKSNLLLYCAVSSGMNQTDNALNYHRDIFSTTFNNSFPAFSMDLRCG